MIKEKDWIWFGNAAHFICGRWCRFHLATQIGKYLVSTVGEFVHPRHSGASEHTENIWLTRNPLGEDIGYGRKFETFVFLAGEPCNSSDCRCGLPEIDGRNLDGLVANDRRTARENHIELCNRFASQEYQKKSWTEKHT